MSKTTVERLFAELIFAADEDIKVDTAKLLASDLGIGFDPEDFDLP